MATKRIDQTNWHGFSTDDKPIEAHVGSVFKCVDTGEEWVYFDGMWIIRPETANTLATVFAL